MCMYVYVYVCVYVYARRLLSHPGLTGARARPHEDRLGRVRAIDSSRGWDEEELDKIAHLRARVRACVWMYAVVREKSEWVAQ